MAKQKERRRFLKLFYLGILFAGSIFSPGKSEAFNNGKSRQSDKSNSSQDRNDDVPIGIDQDNSLKIDIFTHISPPGYTAALEKITPVPPILSDLDKRFKAMDQIGEILQVLTLGQPPIENFPDPEKAADLAKIANDGMAELVARYPDRFAGATAALPMNNIDAAIKELDRAVKELKLIGVQIFTSINGKPLDSPEFMPFYEKMTQYDLPIWIHPISHENQKYYPGEQDPMNNLDPVIGWPHATSMAMMRIAGSGVLERFPNLKFITHHSGGTVPYLSKRIENSPFKFKSLSKPVIESLRLFYLDTAVQGNTANLTCANAFCGADHQLFGTDFPMADPGMVKKVIGSINKMNITDAEKQMIFAGNTRRLLHLSA